MVGLEVCRYVDLPVEYQREMDLLAVYRVGAAFLVVYRVEEALAEACLFGELQSSHLAVDFARLESSCSDIVGEGHCWRDTAVVALDLVPHLHCAWQD